MPEQTSWPVQNSGPTGVLDSRETAQHIGALLTPQTSVLKSKSGFRPGPGASPGVVTATGTPDGFVHVAPFELMLQNIRGSGLGSYLACLDATKDINILSTPADPTNPRDDLVIAQQSDIFDSDANSNFDVKQIVGTPAASPTDPTVTGSTNYVTLARVRVNANATTITSGNITDLRTSGHAKSLTGGLYSVALGGILPVASAAQEGALTGVYPGMQIYRTDLKYGKIYDGTQWVPETGTILAYGERTSDKVYSGTEVGVLRLDSVPIFNGYRYIICTSVLDLAESTSGDTGQAFLRFRTDGTAAGTSDTVLQTADVNANSSFVPRNSATFAEPYVAGANGTLSVLLSLGRSGGSGNITMLGAATRPIRLFIVQGGKDPGNTGVVI